uniref:FecR/PupR family sigma factor regulator n=1 Tax=Burkholderia sp. Ac-20379 TaxID=2703900 RepID=UPI00197EC79A
MRQRLPSPEMPLPDSEAERQAAAWFVTRQGEPGAHDDAAFAAWLAQDARHRAAYARIAETWQALGALPAADIARLKAQASRAHPPASPGRRAF